MFRRSVLASAVATATLLFVSVLPSAAADKVLVFAAASLKGSLDQVATLYEATGGADVSISYAASGPLARQIEAGAPADLFLSADMKWMDYLADKGAVNRAGIVPLLGNRLVLVAARESRIQLKIGNQFALAEALGDGRLALGDVRSVPAGAYGKQALDHYGVWKAVEPKIAPAENVRAALQLVTRGEAPLGIVYETDARAEPGVKVLDTFPEESHTPIVYPLALIGDSPSQEAQAFERFLRGPQAMQIFRQAGFTAMAGS